MSADGLLLVFASERPASTSGTNLWQSERRSLDDEWSEPRQLTGVNSSSADGFPALSADGLALAFSSYREGGRGARDVWISTRPSRDAPWSSPENAGRAVNTSANELPQQILSPEDLLIFTRHEGGTYRDVWAAAIGRENSTFQPAVQLDTSFSSHLEAASFAPDRRTLIYQSARNGANEPAHLRGVRRSRIDSR
jgi:hypothetical protein